MTSSAKIDWPAKLIEAIPLLVGVLITRRFNLQGWKAILAYIAAAGATRQLIGVVESKFNQDHLLTHPAAPAESNGHGQLSFDAQALSLSSSEKIHQVVHATPGRLRVRVPLANNPDYAQQLQQRFDDDQRLQSVRVNSHTASVTVKYDIERFTEAEIRANLSELIRHVSEPFSDHRPSEV